MDTNLIPILSLRKEIRALYVNNFSRCISTGERFETRLCNSRHFQYLQTGFREVHDYEIKVFTTYTEYEIYSLPEFVKSFEVPEVPSLETIYPDWHKKNKIYVQTIYDMYGLIPYDFQINDIALLLMKDSAILSYEQGLGKTSGGWVWARIKRKLDESIKKC